MSPDRANETKMLFCRAGECVVALPVEHVAETMRPLPLESHSGGQTFVLGMSLIRGEPTPVLSAAELIGSKSSTRGTPSRFVLLRVNGRQVALAVDGVIGLASPAAGATGPLAPLVRDVNADVIAAIGRHDGELLVVLEAARVVSRGAP